MLTVHHIEHSKNRIHLTASREIGHSDSRLQYPDHEEVAAARKIIPKKPLSAFQAARDGL